jgi:hypothetical protein
LGDEQDDRRRHRDGRDGSGHRRQFSVSEPRLPRKVPAMLHEDATGRVIVNVRVCIMAPHAANLATGNYLRIEMAFLLRRQ